MNFFSQETLDAAIELTVSFRNRGLTWHSPDQTGSNNSAQQPKTRPPASVSSSKPVEFFDQRKQPIGRPVISSTDQSKPTITPEELENTVFPDNNPSSTYEHFDAYQENQAQRQKPDEIYNWDDADKVPTQVHKLLSHDGPANVLSSRHIPFPTSDVLQPRRLQNVTQPIDFNKELNDLTSTQQLIHGQLGSILTKLDGTAFDQDPIPADGSDCINSSSHLPISFPFHISPSSYSNDLTSSNILWLGSLNVRSLVSSTKQLNLFSLLISHALHGIILTETNLCSPTHRYICNPYISSFNYQSWFTHSPIANRHSGVGIILHSSLAMYIIKKKFYSDRLISLTLQLPGKQNVLLIGGYIPPVSSANRTIIADCHSTLVSWIRSAQSS
ncbi:hypothetical protein RhiirA4_478089 [Rhizophagus irregularis]|uniref:Endonuclease/exonuclease/phosphatase domain-containing protein n=1 Tax=Rhizophagus irregularis TaxID=588596 RepID=A0A2I1HE93_9GLOM|nr:hypothetical protein RhiirA4_478089 [Rhizophagus irregularis]